MTSNSHGGNESTEHALEKYGIMLSYLAYENSTFWTRSGFFLVVHAGLLAFIATSGLPIRSSPLDKMIPSIAITVIGIMLGIAWLLALAGGNYWIDRWHSVLVTLEQDAFKNLNVLRGAVWAEGGETKQSTRAFLAHIGGKYIAYFVAIVFTVLWLGFLICSLAPCTQGRLTTYLDSSH